MAPPTRSARSGSSAESPLAGKDLLLLLAELRGCQHALLLQLTELLEPVELCVVGMLVVRGELPRRRTDPAPGLLRGSSRPPAHPSDPVALLGVGELAARVTSQGLDAAARDGDQEQRQDELAKAVGGPDDQGEERDP